MVIHTACEHINFTKSATKALRIYKYARAFKKRGAASKNMGGARRIRKLLSAYSQAFTVYLRCIMPEWLACRNGSAGSAGSP